MSIIAPSILSADFSRIGEEINNIEKSGVDFLHIDVMDGHFVPNITFGPPVVKSVRKVSKSVFDVHLMISHPAKYIDAFAAAGADYIVFHLECDDDIEETVDLIKSKGIKCGIAIKPKTSPEALFPFVERLDMVLIMTVEPGFGGQSMIDECLDKIEVLKKYAHSVGADPLFEIDGGVNKNNVEYAAKKGADVIVAGNAVFAAENPCEAVKELIELSNS